MSKIGKLITKHAFDSIDIIAELVADAVGADDKRMRTVLTVIKAIVEAVRAGRERKLDPAEVQEKIEESLRLLEQSIKEDRAQARAELDKRFPKTATVKGEPVASTDGTSGGTVTVQGEPAATAEPPKP